MGLRVYLDSCIAIYLIEEHPQFAPYLENVISQKEDLVFAVSDLSEMECLVLPMRNSNEALVRKFQTWFEQVLVLPFEKEIFHSAARIRAGFVGLKTPDALHLAVALYHNCDEFWTNDNRLRKIAPSIVKNILEL